MKMSGSDGLKKENLERMLRGLRASGIYIVRDQNCNKETLCESLIKCFEGCGIKEVELKEIANIFYDNSAEEVATDLPPLFTRIIYGER